MRAKIGALLAALLVLVALPAALADNQTTRPSMNCLSDAAILSNSDIDAALGKLKRDVKEGEIFGVTVKNGLKVVSQTTIIKGTECSRNVVLWQNIRKNIMPLGKWVYWNTALQAKSDAQRVTTKQIRAPIGSTSEQGAPAGFPEGASYGGPAISVFVSTQRKFYSGTEAISAFEYDLKGKKVYVIALKSQSKEVTLKQVDDETLKTLFKKVMGTKYVS